MFPPQRFDKFPPWVDAPTEDAFTDYLVKMFCTGTCIKTNVLKTRFTFLHSGTYSCLYRSIILERRYVYYLYCNRIPSIGRLPVVVVGVFRLSPPVCRDKSVSSHVKGSGILVREDTEGAVVVVEIGTKQRPTCRHETQ